MATEKRLGKISKATFGIGGYQDSQMGLSISLEMQGSGVGDFKGDWGLEIKCDQHCKWTEADRDANFAQTMRYVNQLLIDAKKSDVSKLVGTPVEVELERFCLKSWRVLTEVL